MRSFSRRTPGGSTRFELPGSFRESPDQLLEIILVEKTVADQPPTLLQSDQIDTVGALAATVTTPWLANFGSDMACKISS